MPNNEDIRIYFEEGELVNKYLNRLKRGIKPEKPFTLIIEDDSDSYSVDDNNMKGHTYCDSCQLDILNFCPRCGSLDINGLPTNFTCSSCINTYSQGEMLFEHKKMCNNHIGKGTTLAELLNRDITDYVQCPFCKLSKHQKYLYEHLKACGEKYASSSSVTTPVTIKVNVMKAFGTPYVCQSCKMNFSDVQIYRQHMAQHTVQPASKRKTSYFRTIQPSGPVSAENPPPLLFLNTIGQPVEAQKLNLSVDPRCTYSIFPQGDHNKKTNERSNRGYKHKGMISVASTSMQ